MVFGQSGGGAKIATLMGMPAAHGLFHGAITMSGRQVTASGPLNATARSRAYLAALGDPTIDTLLTMPVERLVEGLSATDPVLGGSVYFGPVLDMKWLDRHPFWPIANPQSNHIPMILGNTRDETRAFIDPDSERVRTLSWDNIAERMAPELRMDSSPEWLVVRYREQIPDWSPERGSSMPRPPPAEAGPARCSRPRRGPAPARSPGFTSSTSSRRPSRAAALRGPGAGHRRLRQGTRTAVQLAQAAERAGADGLLLLPPYLVNSNQDGLSAHRVGDIELMTRIFARMGDRLTYIGGLPTAETFALPYLEMGVTTYSSAIFNFMPDWALSFYAAVRAQDRATVMAELKRFVLPYIAIRNRAPGYAVSIVKAGMTAIGRPAGPVRSPLTDLNQGELDELAALIENVTDTSESARVSVSA